MSRQDYIQATNKAGFEKALKEGKISEEQIGFIEEEDLIWAKGNYYGAVPDNEDLTKDKDGKLQFSDRSYNPANFSGKGYKILRKNIVQERNVLTQEMMAEPNTIYEIRYDFDLSGETINVPEGCVLKFEGGSLKNGTLNNNNNSIVVNNGLNIIFNNVSLVGNKFLSNGNIEYFSGSDDADKLNKALDFFNTIQLLNKTYTINKDIKLKAFTELKGSSNTVLKMLPQSSVYLGYSSTVHDITIMNNGNEITDIFIISDKWITETQKEISNIRTVGTGIKIYDVNVYSDFLEIKPNDKYVIKIVSNGEGNGSIYYSTFNNINISGMWRSAIYIDDGTSINNSRVESWITDLVFNRILVQYCFSFAIIQRVDKGLKRTISDKAGPGKIQFNDCSFQSYDTSLSFLELDGCLDIIFTDCYCWDWNASQHDNNPPIVANFNRVKNIKFFNFNRSYNSLQSLVKHKDLYNIGDYSEYPISFEDMNASVNNSYTFLPLDTFLLGESNNDVLTNKSLMRIPNGYSTIPINYSVYKQLNLPYSFSNTKNLYLEKKQINDIFFLKANIQDEDDNIFELFKVIKEEERDSKISNWLYSNQVGNYSNIDNVPASKKRGYGINLADKKIIVTFNDKLFDSQGNPADALKKGTTSQRPTGVQPGFHYFDTDLGHDMVWDGQEWYDPTNKDEFSDLYKIMYNQHASVSVSSNVPGNIIEKGVPKAVTLSWNYIFNGASTTPDTLQLKSGQDVLVGDKGTKTYTDNIQDTKTYQVVSIMKGVTKTAGITINAYYPIYYGGSSKTTLTSDDVLAFTKHGSIKSNPSGSYNFQVDAGEYAWICVPAGMVINKVTSNGFGVPIEPLATVAVTGKGNYNCYRSSETFTSGMFSCVVG